MLGSFPSTLTGSPKVFLIKNMVEEDDHQLLFKEDCNTDCTLGEPEPARVEGKLPSINFQIEQ